jgi:MFS family permease
MTDSNISDEQRRHSRLVLYQVSFGLALVAINHRAYSSRITHSHQAFHSDLSFIQWVLLVYDLCVIGLVLTLGRLGDLFGRKWIYVSGFLIFAAGSALCGAAQSSAQLILFRVFQGIGGAMIMANGRALVTVNSPASGTRQSIGHYFHGVSRRVHHWPDARRLHHRCRGLALGIFSDHTLGLACAYSAGKFSKNAPPAKPACKLISPAPVICC